MRQVRVLNGPGPSRPGTTSTADYFSRPGTGQSLSSDTSTMSESALERKRLTQLKDNLRRALAEVEGELEAKGGTVPPSRASQRGGGSRR